MRYAVKGFFWLVWLIGWIIYAKTLSANPHAYGLYGFALGAITLAAFFFESYVVRGILANRAAVYDYACGGFVYAMTLFTAILLGGAFGLLGCGLRLLGFGLLLVINWTYTRS